MIFTGELKVHFNTRIIAHFSSIKLQNLSLNPFKEIREFSMVLVRIVVKYQPLFATESHATKHACQSDTRP